MQGLNSKMDVTVVAWWENKPERAICEERYNFTLPQDLPVGLGLYNKFGEAADIYFVPTDAKLAHYMGDDLHDETAETPSVQVGIPDDWAQSFAVTLIETDTRYIVAFHQDPIPPKEVYDAYLAEDSSQATFLTFTDTSASA